MRFHSLRTTCHCALLDMLLPFDALWPSFRMSLKGTTNGSVRMVICEGLGKVHKTIEPRCRMHRVPTKQTCRLFTSGVPHPTNRAVAIYISTTVPPPPIDWRPGLASFFMPIQRFTSRGLLFSSSHLRGRNWSGGVYRLPSEPCMCEHEAPRMRGCTVHGTVEVLGQICRIPSTVNTLDAGV